MPKTITIFEGPDGGGKTTAACSFAKVTGAAYVHFSSMPSIGAGLGRCYVEAMLPALLGYQDVVLDRCWLSEVPYGQVFRGGQERVTPMTRRMLDRLAMRCGAVVVLCLPGEEVAVANFNSRRHLEMLDSDEQLRAIYAIYSHGHLTDLPIYLHNYILHDVPLEDSTLLRRIRMARHAPSTRSAGNLDARVVLVGEGFGPHKPNDAFYQWPFASFDQSGCSQWLTKQLLDADISEAELLWVNADQLDKHTTFRLDQSVIALGGVAHNTLGALDVDHVLVEHPQFWKRFHASSPYRLPAIIKELL